MDVALQLISSHPVLTQAFQKICFHSDGFSFGLMPPSSGLSANGLPHVKALWFFILDRCSLRTDLAALVSRLRSYHPGSRFLVLLRPGVSSFSERIRLFGWGIEGFVDLHETWQAELRRAVDTILQGQLWVPREVLELFARHEQNLSSHHSLTAREQQVLRLVMRGLSNKEIAGSIWISERTVKFHVSNILCKLQVKDRHKLLPDRLKPTLAADVDAFD